MKTIKSARAAGMSIPSFSLTSSTGRTVSSWDYKGRRNLVIFFIPENSDEDCQDILLGFSNQYNAYQERASEILAILHGDVGEASSLAAKLGLPFPVLADENGHIRTKYDAIIGISKSEAVTFICDRFGQIWAYTEGNTCQELFAQEEILRWLDFIEFQCPE